VAAAWQEPSKNWCIWVKANFAVVELICRGGGAVGGPEMETKFYIILLQEEEDEEEDSQE
jgi:hypothetical protein